jgi:hypothetical protein
VDTPDALRPADSTPGTIADRALSIAASFWCPILVLVILTFIPLAVLHFETAAAWVNAYGRLVPAGIGHANVVEAGNTLYEENGLGVGGWPVADIVHDVLLLLAAGLISVYVSDWMGRRRATFSEALARLSERWHVVALCVAAMAGIMLVLRDAADPLATLFFSPSLTDPNLFLKRDVIGPLSSIAIDFIELLVLVLGIGVVATAVLDEGSVGESFIEGVVVPLSRRTWLRTVLLTVGFTVLFRLASWVSFASTLVLNATHSPLLDTIVYVLAYALPTAFVVMTAVTSYVDLTECEAV